jgi:hypothetical protein
VGGATHTMHTTAHPHRRAVRRCLATVALATLVLVGLVAGLIPGTSVDDADPAAAEAVPAGSPGVIRYFGKGAYEGIRAAVAATPRGCALSDDELTALVMAPIFKEVSMAETPQTAPSPMTLSRWDEWSGRQSGSNNLNANFGLYAFRNPNTPYRRAYWTPGIGIFQYDVAGVGAPYSAAEMMNVQYIAGDVAGGMAARYCAAGGDAFTRRSAAWQPWSALGGIAKSESLFQEMLGAGHPPFSTIGLVDGIENAGGMQKHSCIVGGEPVECYYVNPAAAQGANWWATSNVDGGAPASGEAPLTAPFYVIERNGYEERHWMAQDTGYATHVSAQRLIGQNARPRDGQPRSGLIWYAASNICDLDRPEMRCARAPSTAPAAKPAAEPAANKPAAEPEAEDAAAAGESATGVAALLQKFAALRDSANADSAEAGERAADDAAASSPPANSTFSFARGLALVPPASQ